MWGQISNITEILFLLPPTPPYPHQTCHVHANTLPARVWVQAWAIRALSINELTSSRWDISTPTGLPLGEASLQLFGFYTETWVLHMGT